MSHPGHLVILVWGKCLFLTRAHSVPAPINGQGHASDEGRLATVGKKGHCTRHLIRVSGPAQGVGLFASLQELKKQTAKGILQRNCKRNAKGTAKTIRATWREYEEQKKIKKNTGNKKNKSKRIRGTKKKKKNQKEYEELGERWRE